MSLTGGERRQLLPGDILGRHATCAWPIPDLRVSEAHAMVALRRGEVVLLNLRGGLRRRGDLLVDPRLTVGDRLELAPGLALTVEAVQIPDTVWVLEGPGVKVRVDQPISLVGDPLRAVRGRLREAREVLWTDGEHARASGRAGPLAAGDRVVVGDWEGVVRERPVAAAATPATRQAANQRPWQVESHYTTVALFQGGERVLVLSGHGARLLHELVEFDGPVSWEVVARAIWREEEVADALTLRRRWDTALKRLRRRLRAAGLDAERVRSDGCGHIELVKLPGDTLLVRD